jgi:hypothetical protein
MRLKNNDTIHAGISWNSIPWLSPIKHIMANNRPLCFETRHTIKVP